MPVKYRKHYTYYHKGDWMQSYLCLCLRQSDHPVEELKEGTNQPALFALTTNGEMLTS